MDVWQSLGGMTELELTSADLQGALGEISRRNISLYHVSYLSELTVRFQVRRDAVKAVKDICEKRGESLKPRRRFGLYWLLRRFAARPVLLFGCLMYLGLALYLPTRVLFVRVEGNQLVPANAILEAADQAGIRFGASRREVRSEKIKNALLDAIPQLQWAGVNTSGCVAIVSVRERSQTDMAEPAGEVSSIVAAVDGRVYSCTATRGTLLCREGELVRQGQVLISGYTDCGLSIQATRAEGEVYAETTRFLTALTPVQHTAIREITGESKNYSLLLGKNRINFWKTSGNWEGTCGRIYEEYYVTLPGGFRLPLGIGVETLQHYATSEGELAPEEAEPLLTEFAVRTVSAQMVAGSLDTASAELSREEGLYRLEGSYACREMIGRVQREQIGEDYVKNHG